MAKKKESTARSKKALKADEEEVRHTLNNFHLFHWDRARGIKREYVEEPAFKVPKTIPMKKLKRDSKTAVAATKPPPPKARDWVAEARSLTEQLKSVYSPLQDFTSSELSKPIKPEVGEFSVFAANEQVMSDARSFIDETVKKGLMAPAPAPNFQIKVEVGEHKPCCSGGPSFSTLKPVSSNTQGSSTSASGKTASYSAPGQLRVKQEEPDYDDAYLTSL